jgi:hypothetical protein
MCKDTMQMGMTVTSCTHYSRPAMVRVAQEACPQEACPQKACPQEACPPLRAKGRACPAAAS